MEKYKDIIDFILKNKEDQELFNFDDVELKKLDYKTSLIDKEISSFIDSKIHPKCRKKLKRLMQDYTNSLCMYIGSQNDLFYRERFADGIKTILTAISIK